jgi:riboflavin transporter FmnP
MQSPSSRLEMPLGEQWGKLDRVSVSGTAVFAALAVILTVVSQSFGLNFPLLPYLQFDLGEIAILLAFFIFGPVPAVVSSFAEFSVLWVVGQSVPIGPPLKLIAILSSLLGLWVGVKLASHLRRSSLAGAVGLGTALGILSRAVVMTIPNYILIVYLYHIDGMVKYYASALSAFGFSLTADNALLLLLALTAVFNCIQLLFVSVVSSMIIQSPQLKNLKTAGRSPWLLSIVYGSEGSAYNRAKSILSR